MTVLLNDVTEVCELTSNSKASGNSFLTQLLKNTLDETRDEDGSLWNESTIASSGNSDNGLEQDEKVIPTGLPDTKRTNGLPKSSDASDQNSIGKWNSDNGALISSENFTPFLLFDLPSLITRSHSQQAHFLLLTWALLVSRNDESESGAPSAFIWNFSPDMTRKNTLAEATLVLEALAAIQATRHEDDVFEGIDGLRMFFGTANTSAVQSSGDVGSPNLQNINLLFDSDTD
jgi:hypothetical protein